MPAIDVLIIGGGVVGLAAAWRLAAAGAAATLVDAGLPAASDAAAGMLAPSFEHALKAGAPLEALARASLSAWPGFAQAVEEASGESIDLDLSGILEVAFTEEEAAALGAGALSARAAAQIAPGLSALARAARLGEGEGQVDARRLRRALEKAFQNAGGSLVRGSRIVSVERCGDGLRALGADGGAFRAARVVAASGVRGIPGASLPEGALYPVKGEALALARSAGGPSRVIRATGAYLCPKSDGRIVVGASEAPRDWSITADAKRVAALRAGDARRALTIAETEVAALKGGREKLCAKLIGTLVVLAGRPDLPQAG